jgi:hypothetical protein
VFLLEIGFRVGARPCCRPVMGAFVPRTRDPPVMLR